MDRRLGFFFGTRTRHVLHPASKPSSSLSIRPGYPELAGVGFLALARRRDAGFGVGDRQVRFVRQQTVE